MDKIPLHAASSGLSMGVGTIVDPANLPANDEIRSLNAFLLSISPMDIALIDVLKTIASSAAYGLREVMA